LRITGAQAVGDFLDGLRAAQRHHREFLAGHPRQRQLENRATARGGEFREPCFAREVIGRVEHPHQLRITGVARLTVREKPAAQRRPRHQRQPGGGKPRAVGGVGDHGVGPVGLVGAR